MNNTNVKGKVTAILITFVIVVGLGLYFAATAEADSTDFVLPKLEAAYIEAINTSTKAGEMEKLAVENNKKAKESLCKTRDALRAYKEMQGYEVQDKEFTCDFQ